MSWVVSYSSIDDSFDYEPVKHHLRSNFETLRSGGMVFHTTVEIVEKIEDCHKIIKHLRRVIPRSKFQPKKVKLNTTTKMVLDLRFPMKKSKVPNFREMTPEQRERYCDENFDLDFPDDFIDDPER